jgi:D-erythronate 2-dehydrogenase
MKILLTGAFGNIGNRVLDTLLQRGHQITCLDLPNAANQKAAANYQGSVQLVWGDIRDKALLEQCIAGQDVIVHMAAIIPPLSEQQPTLSQAINVEASCAMMDIAARLEQPPLFVFTSSFAVFGERQHEAPPRTINDAVIATDHYSQQKIACEQYLQQHYPHWCILRLGAAVDERMFHTNTRQLQMALELAANNRVEFVHPQDIATAIANAVQTPAAHQQIHLIGGGASCQIRHIDLLNTMSGALGIRFRPEDFGTKPLYADWADTQASEQLLHFQQHSFADLQNTVQRKFRFVRYLVTPFSGLIRFVLLKMVK